MNFKDLRRANQQRDIEWDPLGKITPQFRAIELGGEVGEALNVVKKIMREQIGLRGSRATFDDLATELADIIICTDLLAMSCDIDLADAVRKKFNATSEKQGLSVLL